MDSEKDKVVNGEEQKDTKKATKRKAAATKKVDDSEDAEAETDGLYSLTKRGIILL